jgi:hypothetical protein
MVSVIEMALYAFGGRLDMEESYAILFVLHFRQQRLWHLDIRFSHCGLKWGLLLLYFMSAQGAQLRCQAQLPTLSRFPRRLSAGRWLTLFSHKCHESKARIERVIKTTIDACSGNFATEVPCSVARLTL